MRNHVEHIAVARDSGFGDDYFAHVECVSFMAGVGEPHQVPLASIPPSYRFCFHCGYRLAEAARPTSPKAE